MARATASVVLFLEYVPHTVHGWLDAQLVLGEAHVAAACVMIEREAGSVIAVMQAHGFVHFDPHFHNLLTDGDRLYFADLGLASSRQFELADAERAFLDHHASYDACVIASELVDWLRWAYPAEMPAFAAAICERLGPTAAILRAFYDRLRADKSTPFTP
jgi:tRNA A-37 threonylcarbamoyl transferase component Bud32